MSDDTPKMTPNNGKNVSDRNETQRTQAQVESSLRSLMACEAVQAVRDDLNNLRQQRQAARITALFNRLEESDRFGREFGLASGAFTQTKSEE